MSPARHITAGPQRRNRAILAGVPLESGRVSLTCAFLVAQDVEPYVVVAGNPARVIRRLERPADAQ